MKKTGAGNYNGPCPLCGGTDRFHLSDKGGKVLFGCRGCLDGKPNSNTRFGELMRTLRLRTATAPQPPTKRRSPASTSTPAHTDEDLQAMDYALRLWAAGMAADLVPEARRFFARDWVYPPIGVPDIPKLSTVWVCWLPKSAEPVGKPKPNGKILRLPSQATGTLLYGFTDREGVVTAVQFEALTAKGDHALWTDRKGEEHRFRYIEGRIRGDRYMRIGPRNPGAPEGLVLTEGVRDALAAWWIWGDWVVWATGGTSGFSSVQPEHLAGFDRVILAADGDEAGHHAIQSAKDRLFGAGVRGIELWSGEGDLADRLKELNRDEAARQLKRIAEKRGGLDATKLTLVDRNDAILGAWASWWTPEKSPPTATTDSHPEPSPVNGRTPEPAQPESLPPAFELCCQIFDAKVLQYTSAEKGEGIDQTW